MQPTILIYVPSVYYIIQYSSEKGLLTQAKPTNNVPEKEQERKHKIYFLIDSNVFGRFYKIQNSDFRFRSEK